MRVTTPWDLCVTAALAALAVVETLTLTDGPHPAMRASMATLTMLGLALRRTMPLTASVLVALGVVAETVVLGPAEEVAVLLGIVVAAFSVAAYAPLREALVGHALLGTTIVLAMSLDATDSPSSIPPTILLFLVVPGVLGVTVHRRGREVAALELRAARLAGEAEAAVEAERRRIARELHDVVSHAVTLIAVQAEAGQAMLDSDPEAARRSLRSIGDVSREALAELGRLLELLHDADPPGVPDAGLARLDALVEGARAAGLTVRVTETGVRRPLPAAADHCAYRVVQEALTNALRHASGARVEVTLDHGSGGEPFRVRVDTTGRRHTSAYGGTGRGLVGLRERVVGLGGTFEADPTPEGSFGIRATLPVGSR